MLRQNAAFTLLEVILALALSVLLVMALTMAVDLNLRLLDAGRTQVEEAQLARSVLQVLARDLANTVYMNPSDVKKLMSSAPMASVNKQNSQTVATQNQSTGPSSQGGQANQGGNQSSGQSGQSGQGGQSGRGNQSGGQGGQSGQGGQGQGGGQGGQSGQSGQSNRSGSQSSQSGPGGQTGQSGQSGQSGQDSTEDTETDRTSDLADAAPQTMPGLYGNAYELLVDVSRAPRTDQIIASQQNDNTETADRLSDTKTVAYYVISNSNALPLTTGNELNTARGLVRRQVDRASALYAAQSGQVAQTDNNNLEPFAPEVESIQFRYFDGTQWWDQWDSIAQNGLPQAVDITIAVTRQHPRNAAQMTQPLTYTLWVKIPAAKPAAAQTSSTQSSSTQSTSSKTSQ